tara:strand:+ start:603 stop:893 length:291 start_codon:yes stop_codon:yes gene_type:complete
MIDKSKLQEHNSSLNVNFEIHKVSIKQRKDKKWLLMVSCRAFLYVFEDWETMMAQLIMLFTDPDKFYKDNNLATGSRILNDVDPHVINKYAESITK